MIAIVWESILLRAVKSVQEMIANEAEIASGGIIVYHKGVKSDSQKSREREYKSAPAQVRTSMWSAALDLKLKCRVFITRHVTYAETIGPHICSSDSGVVNVSDPASQRHRLIHQDDVIP